MFFKFSKIEDYPNAMQAFKARDEAKIVEEQPVDIFLSNTVVYVINELELLNRDKYHNNKMLFAMSIFNYGYIMGKRAERQRKHKTT